MKKAAKVDISVVRTAIADYMRSEGCSCCQNIDAHREHASILAKLLHVPRYSDGSGYDFGKFESKREKGGA